MSVHTITVTLEKDVSDEWAEKLCESIKTMRGVLRVTTHEVTHSDYWALENAKTELGQKLWDVLYPTSGKK